MEQLKSYFLRFLYIFYLFDNVGQLICNVSHSNMFVQVITFHDYHIVIPLVKYMKRNMLCD